MTKTSESRLSFTSLSCAILSSKSHHPLWRKLGLKMKSILRELSMASTMVSKRSLPSLKFYRHIFRPCSSSNIFRSVVCTQGLSSPLVLYAIKTSYLYLLFTSGWPSGSCRFRQLSRAVCNRYRSLQRFLYSTTVMAIAAETPNAERAEARIAVKWVQLRYKLPVSTSHGDMFCLMMEYVQRVSSLRAKVTRADCSHWRKSRYWPERSRGFKERSKVMFFFQAASLMLMLAGHRGKWYYSHLSSRVSGCAAPFDQH